MAIDLVRVKLENGTEASVSPKVAARHNLKVLDKPAVARGRAIAAKPKTSVAAKASESKSSTDPGRDSSASTKEESK